MAGLNWNAQAGALAFNNTSERHVVVGELKLNGLPITKAPVVLHPGEARELPFQAKAGDEVSLSHIDDYGSTEEAPVTRIH